MSTVDPFAIRELLGADASPCRRAITGEHGVSLPPFLDHHVHLHLIEDSTFASGGIAAVVDLGGDPAALARRPHDQIPHVAYAGAFLTAPGGYPAGRSWAPSAIVREITSDSLHSGVAGGVATAVDEQLRFGASVIKVALHAGTTPLDIDTLRALVSTAHERGLPVAAHVQGERMLRLAVDTGVDVLAHTPFSERADDALIAEAVTAGQAWISTLDIHRHDPASARIARENLAAFAAAGGRVLYGTDLGNGDLPVGVNVAELTALHGAGVQGTALVAALTDHWPFAEPPAGVLTFVAGDAPTTAAEIPEWLGGATVVPQEELVHDE
jgi:hypothetical protein